MNEINLDYVRAKSTNIFYSKNKNSFQYQTKSFSTSTKNKKIGSIEDQNSYVDLSETDLILEKTKAIKDFLKKKNL